MWSLTDHLIALLVLGVLLMILLATQRDGRVASVEGVIRSDARAVLNQTADWIERDLANLGAGVPDGEAALVAYAWAPEHAAFTFRTMPDTSAEAVAETVRYERVDVSGGEVPRYEVRRYVLTDAGGDLQGRTPPTVRAFDVTLRNAAGEPFAGEGSFPLADVRSVEVLIVMDPPLGASGPPLTWRRRFYPPGLAAGP